VPDLAPFTLPIFLPHLAGRAGSELLLSASSGPSRTARTMVLDVAEWPPRITEHAGYESTLDAARSPSGRWLLHVNLSLEAPRIYRLRTYARGADTHPAADDPTPFPMPHLGEVLAHMDEVSQRIESAHTYAIESLHFAGERALLVPRHVGLGDYRYPWIERDGGWVEERGVPPFTKSAAKSSERCVVRGVRLGDGSDVLLWDGWSFEVGERGLARTFEHRIEAPWWHHWEPVPAGSDGFFYLDTNCRLGEIRRGGAPPRKHVPEMPIDAMGPGPNGTVLLQPTAGGVLLYDPGDASLAEVPADMLPPDKHRDFVAWCEPGLLVACQGLDPRRLFAVAREDLEALPRKSIAAVVKARAPKIRGAADAVEGPWAASRPRVALDRASGIVAVADERVVRAHAIDAPAWQWKSKGAIVAVAAAEGVIAALTKSGRLVRLDARTGKNLGAIELGSYPRSLAGSTAGAWAVLRMGGVHLVRGDEASKLPFEAPLAASFDGDGGRLLLTGERRRAAIVTVATGALDALPEPPEEVHAVAWEGGDTWLALSEKSILRLDAAARTWTHARGGSPGNHLACSPGGALVAAGLSRSGAEVLRAGSLEPVTSVSYPDTFQNTEDPLRVVGLAFLDDRQLVVGLTRGNGNILVIRPPSAMRLDPPPGQVADRWVFVYGGKILVAG
jgi:hypothetical protein